MGDEQRQAAKVQMMALMQAGHPWQEAANKAGLHPSRSTAYRWFQHFQACGEAALQDGRHGHVHKVYDPVLQWLRATCHAAPHVSSARLQHELHEQMGVQVSITHLNRLRAAHGLTRQAGERGEKAGPVCTA